MINLIVIGNHTLPTKLFPNGVDAHQFHLISHYLSVEACLTHINSTTVCDVIIIDPVSKKSTMEIAHLKKLKTILKDSQFIIIAHTLEAEYTRTLMYTGIRGIITYPDINNGTEFFIKSVQSGQFIISPVLLKTLFRSHI